MDIIMFIVGGGIFTSFLISLVWEAKNEEKSQTENYENYGGEGCNQPTKKVRQEKDAYGLGCKF